MLVSKHGIGGISMHDDGCDYTAVILDRQNAAARARTRTGFRPAVKPVKVSDISIPEVSQVFLGDRMTFSRGILEGIYHLQMLGYSAETISERTGIGLLTVKDILRRKTNSHRAAFSAASVKPLSNERAIFDLIRIADEKDRSSKRIC